ncbi:hypothetical protein ACSQ67_014291 [Phaseolus vulgaris]
MSSRGFVRGASLTANAVWHRRSFFPTVTVSVHRRKLFKFQSFSSTTSCSSLPPPDLPRLAKTAQISLTPNEVEEIAPKIQQVIDWFGQLQGVDLESVEPSIRAAYGIAIHKMNMVVGKIPPCHDEDHETENNLRDNAPETFQHRDAMIASVPSYEEPYIKVPRVLSMD